MKNKKTVLIVLAVLAVVLGGLGYWSVNHPNPTAGWKTYTNAQYTFSFKYPANYRLLTLSLVPKGQNVPYTETDAEMDLLNKDTAPIASDIYVDSYPLSTYPTSLNPSESIANWTQQDAINQKSAIDKNDLSNANKPDDAIVSKIIGKTLVYAQISHQSATLYYYMISYDSNTDRIIINTFGSNLNNGALFNPNQITAEKIESDPTWQMFVNLAKSFNVTK